MLLNDENKLCAYKDDIVFLWEPGRKDRMYRVALLLRSYKIEENEKYEGTKVLFVENGKVFNVSELDNDCAFYKTMNSNCLHNSFGSFEIYLDKIASKLHEDFFKNGAFFKNYLNYFKSIYNSSNFPRNHPSIRCCSTRKVPSSAMYINI